MVCFERQEFRLKSGPRQTSHSRAVMAEWSPRVEWSYVSDVMLGESCAVISLGGAHRSYQIPLQTNWTFVQYVMLSTPSGQDGSSSP